MAQVICYVDGLNLYYGLKFGSFRDYLWLDLWQLASRLLLSKETLVAIKYFYSPMKAEAAKLARQGTYNKAIKTRIGMGKIPCLSGSARFDQYQP